MIKSLTLCCLFFLALLLPLLVNTGCKLNSKIQTLELKGNSFEVHSWNEFPDTIKYKLFYVNGSKNELVLNGMTEDQLPEFERTFVNDDAVFAKYDVSYLRISDGNIDVFSWASLAEQYDLFIDYFHWLIDNRVYLDCINISIALYKHDGDKVALSFLEDFASAEQEAVYESLNASELHSFKIRRTSVRELLGIQGAEDGGGSEESND